MPVALEAACLEANWCADAAKICTDREMQMNNKLLIYQQKPKKEKMRK